MNEQKGSPAAVDRATSQPESRLVTRAGFSLAGKPASSLWMPAATAIILMALALGYGCFTVLTTPLSLDEGYVMISVRGFLEHHPLYDSVFTQYGPFYYFYQWIIHTALGMPLTHDATRLLCLFHWVSASVLLAIAGGVLTRSVLGGIFVFMQAVIHLTPIANEPGHPQEIVALLLALAALLGSRPSGKTSGRDLLASIGVALLFTKVNIGIFFVLALAISLLWHREHRWARGAWSWLLIATCAMLPLVLMRRHAMEEWCRNYALLGAGTLIAALLTGRDASSRSLLGVAVWFRPAMILAALAVAFAGLTLLTGTSFQGLLSGLIRMPLQTAAAAFVPFPVSDLALCNVAASLSLAAVASMSGADPTVRLVLTLLKAILGLLGSIFWVSDPSYQLAFLWPWVWLVLVHGPKDRAWEGTFPRVWLCSLAAWQGLQAYPVAGTQVAIAGLLLVLVCTLCLADTLSALSLLSGIPTLRDRLTPGKLRLAEAVLGLGAICVFGVGWCQLPRLHRFYTSLQPLDLKGATRLRVDLETRQLYHGLVAYLDKNSDTYLMCPAINSLYFWTRPQPPTHLNCTALSLLTPRQEEQMFLALNRAERPLIVMHEAAMPHFSGAGATPVRPMVRTLRDDYVEIDRIPPYRIFGPKNRAKTAGSSASVGERVPEK